MKDGTKWKLGPDHTPVKVNFTPKDTPTDKPPVKIFTPRIAFMKGFYLPGSKPFRCIDELGNFHASIFKHFFPDPSRWPSQKSMDDLAIKIRIYILEDHSAFEKKEFEGKPTEYRNLWVDLKTSEIAVVYSGSWEKTRNMLLPALLKMYLNRWSDKTPSWVVEGLIPIYCTGKFIHTAFIPEHLPGETLISMVDAIKEDKVPTVRQLFLMSDSQFTDNSRLAACGVVFWFMESKKSNAKIFSAYLHKLRKGKDAPKYLERQIKGNFAALDKAWQKFVHTCAKNRGVIDPDE